MTDVIRKQNEAFEREQLRNLARAERCQLVYLLHKYFNDITVHHENVQWALTGQVEIGPGNTIHLTID